VAIEATTRDGADPATVTAVACATAAPASRRAAHHSVIGNGKKQKISSIPSGYTTHRSNLALDIRSKMSEIGIMTGNEFIRRVRRLGRKNGTPVEFVARRGKGSHGTLYYGARFTIVRNPKDDLKKGTLHAMLNQLGLTQRDL
jgi:mRNA interferase HicA